MEVLTTFSRIKRKRFLGIPAIGIIVLVVMLIACVGGGAALGAWLFNQSNNATLVVKGAGMVAYKDAGCTQILAPSDVLAFGDVRASQPSASKAIYLKNVGSDPIRPSIKQTGLNALFQLDDATKGQIGTTYVLLYTPASWPMTLPGTAQVATAIDASSTQLVVKNVTGPIQTSGLIKITNPDSSVEWMNCTSYNSGTLTATVVRAQHSTAIAHPVDAEIDFGTAGTFVPEVALAPGGVVSLSLTVATQGDVSSLLGQTLSGWTIDVRATSDY